jgi:hypothetical protein
MLSDKEFFLKLKQYIEDVEHQIDGEWGNCRSVEQLISDGAMPDLYFQVLQRITSVAQPAPEGVSLAHEAYVAFVQICKGNSDDAGTYEADEELVRCALKRLSDLEKRRPAIKPVSEPEGPTDEELWQIWHDVDGSIPTIFRAVLARFGRPAIEPEVPPMPVPVA